MSSTADTPPPAHARPQSVVRVALRWGVALILLGIMLRYVVVHAGELRGTGLTLRPLVLAASLPVLLAYLCGRVLVWHTITVVAGTQIALPKAFVAWNYSLLGKYVPGKVFLLLARVHFYRLEGRSGGRVTFAFFLETVATLFASALTILLALLFHDVALVAEHRGVLVVALVFLAAAMHPRILEPLLNLALRLLRRPAVSLDVRYVHLLGCVALATANWLLFGFGFYLLINAVYEVQVETIVYLAGAISLASLAGIFAILAPSGLGVREGVLALLLSEIMTGPLAAAIALASRVWVTAGEALVIGLTFVLSTARLPSLSRPQRATGSSASPVQPAGDTEHPRNA